MKRILACLLILLLLLTTTGCKSNREDFEVGADLESNAPVQEDAPTQPEEKAPTPEQPDRTPENPPAQPDQPHNQVPDTPVPDKEPEKQPEQSPAQPDNTPQAPKVTNLFNKAETTANTAVWETGTSGYRQDYHLSAALPVQEGDQITYGPAAAGERLHGFSYSSGNPTAPINSRTAKEEGIYGNGMRIYTYTVPKGVTYLQFNVPTELKDIFMLSKNETFTTADAQTTLDPLTGKTALFVGDSICYGSRDTAQKGAWAGRIAASTGLIATNNGKSGTSLSDSRKDRHGLIHDQLLKSAEQDFDYVVLHGGVNDAWDSVPVGKISRGFTPNYFDTTTFAGGLERLIYTAVTTYGDTAAIGYLFNFKAPRCENGTTSDMSEYAEVAKEICEKWGIPCFDMYNHQQLTKELAYHTNAHTTDFIHPNPEGYEILTPYIADFMGTLPPCDKGVLAKNS